MNDYIQCTAPSSWASYLINDDHSGLEDSEIIAVEAWLAHNQLGHCYGCEDAGFLWSHDATGFALASDCQLYTFEG